MTESSEGWNVRITRKGIHVYMNNTRLLTMNPRAYGPHKGAVIAAAHCIAAAPECQEVMRKLSVACDALLPETHRPAFSALLIDALLATDKSEGIV